MIRPALLLLALTLVGAAAPQAEPRYQSSPERRTVAEKDWGPWLQPFREKLVPSLMQDFGERYLYAPANAALPLPKPGEQRVVFIGDSITDGWNLAKSFPGKPYINRGIGSQVTAQMLVRFEQDVVALHPSAVVILGGINDVMGFLQIETPDTIVANIAAMADIARAHGIAVVLCSVMPVNNYTENARDMLEQRPPAVLAAINTRLRALATRRHYAYADYFSVLHDSHDLLAADLTRDGIHPTRAGYARMAPIAAAAVRKALSQSR